MKRTDVAMIVLIAAVSAGIAYFVASSILGGVSEQTAKVKTIDPITSTVETPDPKIFNESAINPSVEVNINNTEPDPATADTVDASDTRLDTDPDTINSPGNANTP